MPAGKWASATAHNRAQVLYFIAENLSAREAEFAARIIQLTACEAADAQKEVEKAIERIFLYAAHADKYDGLVHHTPIRNVTLAMNEPVGVMGMVCPEELPLLGLVSMLMPAIAMGNRVVIIPSEKYPLVATDFYQILDTSDVPAGVVNIVTGQREVLSQVLARHDDVDALWYMGSAEGSKFVEEASAENMKRTWVNHGLHRDWYDEKQGEGVEFLRKATEVKNIWVPYGD